MSWHARPDITITPNHHALARRFGLFDRFFVNAEVSSQGHIWSTAAYVTNYGEKTVPSGYAGKRADVDGEESDEPLAGEMIGADVRCWSGIAQAIIRLADELPIFPLTVTVIA